MLLLGLAEAIAGPYLVLFAADAVGASRLRIGVLASGMSTSGILVSTWLGRQYDRRPSGWPAILAAVCPTLGYALLPGVRGYPLLLSIGVALLGPGYAGFPQLFVMARDYLALGGTLGGGRANAVLRSVWSTARAAGPAAFSNTALAGSLVAGLIAGALAEGFGYQVALLSCGVLSGLALLLLATASRRRWRSQTATSGG